MKDFTAIDIELANNDPSSICEIGAARFRNSVLIETWRTILNPESDFEVAFHSNIHGITKSHAESAPTFPEIHATLARLLANESCVYHSNSGFDENCLRKACKAHALQDVTLTANWYSTISIARTHLPNRKSYKLKEICKDIGHDYLAHNALEDAMASAAIVLVATKSGSVISLAGSGGGAGRPRTFRKTSSRKRQSGLHGNPDGPFFQTPIVITGILLPPWQDRSSLEKHLHELGFAPRGSVSGKTKILLIGSGPGLRKIEKAKELGTQIMDEDSFWKFVENRR